MADSDRGAGEEALLGRPELVRVPVLSTFLGQIREQRGLDRTDAASMIALSTVYLGQIESGRRRPSPEMLDSIIAGYGMTAAQAGHARNLLADPLDLPSVEWFRRQVAEMEGLTWHLADLSAIRVPAVLLDPVAEVLASNADPALLMPGLLEVGNYVSWCFTPSASEVLLDWPAEADFAVSALQRSAGRFRSSRRLHRLLRSLSTSEEFIRRWSALTEVTYLRPIDHCMVYRDPDTGIRSATIHRTVVGEAGMALFTAYPRKVPPRRLISRWPQLRPDDADSIDAVSITTNPGYGGQKMFR
ncbi:helix-turn-helix domain-containing protein [Nocardia sp. NPDC004068]|uniref:MmyB family transcriptional regulator n=1 Tax=Nocardia sp. NPDC004068 TaxID=3364303 RepID=UPI00369C4A82